MTVTRIIDVHSHALTEARLMALRRDPGSAEAMGREWRPTDTIAMMDRHGIGESILSMPVSFASADPARARDLARRMNEELAAVVRAAPDRFGAFAVLPMAHAEDAIAEAEYALDVLKLDGVGMTTNVGGAYLGEPRFHPVFEMLNRRQAVVFIHPTTPTIFQDVSLGIDVATLEYMFDSTRMITSLVYNGVMRRCRDLTIISTHGGGTLPYIAGRIATHAETRNARLIQPMSYDDVMEDLRSFYFDLTAAISPPALAALLELVPKSHLLTGFDYPIRPERLFQPDLQALAAYPGLTDDDRAAIFRTNALDLFPRFAAASVPAPAG